MGEAVIAESSEHLVVMNTCPDSETAGRIAADLVGPQTGRLRNRCCRACNRISTGTEKWIARTNTCS